MQDGARMRVECNHGRDSTHNARTLNHRPHNQLMAEMQSVKDAQRQDRRPRYLRVVCSVEKSHKVIGDKKVMGDG
jgi:hypothetical protein